MATVMVAVGSAAPGARGPACVSVTTPADVSEPDQPVPATLTNVAVAGRVSVMTMGPTAASAAASLVTSSV